MHNDQQGLELKDPQLTKDHTQTQTQIGVEGIAVRIKLKNPKLRNAENGPRKQLAPDVYISGASIPSAP